MRSTVGGRPSSNSPARTAGRRAVFKLFAAGILAVGTRAATAQASSCPACDPRASGAAGDGVQDDTTALQAALDTCAGRRVRLAPGTYRTRPLFMSSGTTLEVSAGALLIGSDDPAAYERDDGGLNALLNASNATDISIEGGGVIDGSGAGWWERVRAARAAGAPDPPRPRLIAFDGCDNVRVASVTLQNSPSFHLVFSFCSGIQVERVTIVAPADSPNTDGIDIISTRSVRIRHCSIDNGDDNIAIKSEKAQPDRPDSASANIAIERCAFLHGHGVSIGSETYGGVHRVRVSHCRFSGTENGVRIKTDRTIGGPISAITYERLQMTDVQTPIAFASYYPKVPAHDTAQAITSTTPSVSGILVRRLTATGATQAGSIIGLPEAPYTDIQLAGVRIAAETGLRVRDASVAVADTAIAVGSGPAYVLEEGGVVSDRAAEKKGSQHRCNEAC